MLLEVSNSGYSATPSDVAIESLRDGSGEVGLVDDVLATHP